MSDIQYPPPPPEAPWKDSGARYTFINPDTGETTTNLTGPEVIELEEKWRADYEAAVQAKIEADNAAYVPPPYEENEEGW